MKIWGAGTPRSLRPLWVAEELGLDYEHAPIGPRTGETRTPEFTSLNPKQKIPVLVDGDIRLSESVAICRYLISAYPSDTLKAPATIQGRATEDEWCCYIYGELDETSLYIVRRHRDLGEIYGASEEVVQSATAYAQRHFDVVAGHLAGRDYLLHDTFSLPDILLVSCLDWAVFYNVDIPAALQDYRDRIAERPAYRNAMQTNYGKQAGEIDGTISGN